MKIYKSHIKSMRILFLTLFLMGVMVQSWAQNISAGGLVVDINQEPLIGVTIKVAGTTNGTLTDMDGKFELACPSGSMLEFTYIGYYPQKMVAASSMKIILEENAIVLKEAVIVSIGYGTMRKSDLTGAISSISQEDLKKGVVTSAEQLLQGKIAGLAVVQGSGEPSAGASVRLRGGSSLSASSNPLYVVDGIPGVDINTVQPSEIVSVDVLKDASASAIYGSQGANGVIMVTTNRSSSVESRKIEYNGYVALGQVAKHMDLLSANQWRDYVRTNNIKDAIDYGGDTDWQKEIERTAFTHSHNVFFSNVAKESGYSVSLTSLNSEGVIITSNMERLSGSVAAHQYGLNKKLKLDVGITASSDKWNPLMNDEDASEEYRDYRVFERVANLNPTVPVKDQNGKYTSIGGTNTENPVEILNNRTADSSRKRLLGYGKIQFEISKELKWVGNASYEFNSKQNRFYLPSYAMIEGISEKGRGVRSLGEFTNTQFETYLTYDKEINKIHRLNAMAGYSYLENVYEGYGAARRGFDTDDFSYNNLGAGSDYRQGDVYSYKGQGKLISFYGRANYSLMNKYMLTATFRRDGSSKMGANNKWENFPSLSAAWRVSEESFMNGTKSWLDNLKLRLGYGASGNQGSIGNYQSLALLGANGASYYDPDTGIWKNSYTPTQNPNPDLKWETVQQTNLGIDFVLLNRFTGTIELYHKKTVDLLWEFNVPQPPYLYGTKLVNAGNLVNKGVELSLATSIAKTKDFDWDASFNISYNHQEITKLSNDEYLSSGANRGSLHNLRGFSGIYTQKVMEGYPAGAFFGPVAIGLDEDGKYVMKTNEKGEVVEEYLGSAQPKVNLGISTSLKYRDFDMNIATYGMFGQKVLNATYMSMYDPTRLPSQNVPDSYLTSGIKSPATYSDYWVEDGSFFRLQSLTLGYTLPFNLKKAGFDRIRFYMTGENLFVITGYTGVDPEVSIEGLNYPGITRFNTYPRPRTYTLGVSVTF